MRPFSCLGAVCYLRLLSLEWLLLVEVIVFCCVVRYLRYDRVDKRLRLVYGCIRLKYGESGEILVVVRRKGERVRNRGVFMCLEGPWGWM